MSKEKVFADGFIFKTRDINVTEMTIFLKYFVINIIGYTTLFFLLFFLIEVVTFVTNSIKKL